MSAWDNYRPRPRTGDDYGYLYAMRQERGRRIKFGFSNDVERRAAQIGSACGSPIRVLAFIPCILSDEHRLHAALAPYRSYGEWYNPTRQILDIVTFMRDGMTAEAVLAKAGAK